MSTPRPLALVTGASAGIGHALAQQCLQHGFDVVITGASDRVHQARDRLATLDAAAQVIAVRSDLRTEAGVEQVWAAVQDTGRPLALGMLNAGTAIGGAFVDTDLQAEVEQIQLNVISQVRLAKPMVRHMVANGAGRVLFTSSLSATTPTPYETVYGPSRAFVYSFAQSLREELKGTGVSVTALLPGATATEFHQRAGMHATAFGDNSWKADPADVARLGFEGVMSGRDHVIGVARGARWISLKNRLLPETVKAARQAKMARPR